MKKSLLKYLLIASFALISFSGYGAEAVKEDAFRMKTMEGEIMGKTRANLSVQYKQDGNQLFEAVIPVDEKIRLKGYKNFLDIQNGDLVKVEFKETYKLDDEGKEIRTGRMATSVHLVKNSVAGKLISKD